MFFGLVSTEVTLEIQIRLELIFLKTIASTIIETECFFHLSGFFVEFCNLKEKLNNFYSIFPTIMEKLNKGEQL